MSHALLSSRMFVLALVMAVPLRAQAPAASPHVPLVAGLTVVHSISASEGDYQSMLTIDAVNAAGMQVTVTGEVPNPRAKPERVTVSRNIRAQDMRDARTYKYRFNTADAADIPGTTGMGASTAVLNDARAKGRTSFAIDGRAAGLAGALGGLLGALGGTPEVKKMIGSSTVDSGTLTVVERSVMLSVLLNNHRASLATIHLRGRLGSGDNTETVDLYLLDDPENPMALKYSFGDATLEVTQIDFPVAVASNPMEEELLQNKRTAVYGIYFDFNSATIRPQSELVLRQIVTMMKREPEWKLRVEGHTDSIGGDASNLDLSARRAAAVKQALVERGVVASRLTTGGFGASVPRETNGTLAGRARNRRVELSRQ